MTIKGSVAYLGLIVCLFCVSVAACQLPAIGDEDLVGTPTRIALENRAAGSAQAAATPSRSPTSTTSPTPTPTPTATPTATPTPAPTVRLQLAQEAAHIGEIETAITHYQAITDTSAFSETALFELGRLYEREARWQQASETWDTYLAQFPDGERSAHAHFRLGRSYAERGQHERAIAHFLAYDLERDIADDVVAEALGRSLHALDRNDGAITQYERVYEHPDVDRVTRALTARTLADLHAEQEAWADAVEWYERSLQGARIPSYRAELLAAIANAEQEQGNLEEAVAHWQQLVEDYPQMPEALRAAGQLEDAGTPISLFQRGIVYYENGEWDAAVQAMYDSIEEEEDRAEAHWYAALAYRDAGNLDAAWREFGTLIETHRESDLLPNAWLERGRIRQQQENVDAALQVYARVVTEFPDDDAAPVALWESVTLLKAEDDLRRAALLALDLADRYPEYERAPQAEWEAGLLYYRLEEYNRATTIWESVASTSSYARRAHYWLAKAADAAGDTERARDLWTELAAGDDYYALRAQAQSDGTSWTVRSAIPIRRVASSNDVEWLREHLALEPDAEFDPLALPTEPALARGDELELLGMSSAAYDAYRQAVAAASGDAQALYALAHHFAEREPAVSISAAYTLLTRLDVPLSEAPASVGRLVYPIHYTELIQEQAEAHDIDPLLLAALIYQESRWQPSAQSSAAARGLTQVIPDTGQWIAQQLGESYDNSRLYRPSVSLRYGAYYLDWVLDRFDDNPFYALAGYNGGPGNVPRWMAGDDVDLFVENITLTETRAYVELVYQHWHAYNALYR